MGRKKKPKKPLQIPAEPVAEPNERLALWVVLIVYAALAALVVCIIPHETNAVDVRLTPPDESAHWLYVKELATTGKLPVFGQGYGNYEAHQPPLYYASVLWSYWIAGDNGVYLARVWSVLLSAMTLLVAWQILGMLLGTCFWTRLGALAALAFIPGRLFVVTSVSNDALYELLAAVVLWLSLRTVRDGAAWRTTTMLGAAAGLALLTKTSGLVLLPGIALAYLLEPSWRKRGIRHVLAHGAVIVLMIACLWGWWVARNMALYGEPLAMNRFQEIFLKDRPSPDFFLSRGMTWSGYWTLVAWQTWLSLWGVFGQATVYMPGPFYSMGSVLGLLCIIGLVVLLVRARRDGWRIEPSVAAMWAVGLAMFLLTLATFLQFNTVFYQAQARYFLGASIFLAAALAAGVFGLAPRVGPRRLPLLAIAFIPVQLAWAIIAFLTSTYSFLPPMAQ